MTGCTISKLILTLLGFLPQVSALGVESETSVIDESIGPRLAVQGIPQPGFGLQSPIEFSDQLDSGSTSGSAKRTADGSPYTHFVDNSHPNSTDSSNAFGTTERPRKTLPENISAGSIVEIRGGPYVTSDISLEGLRGTSDNPIFIHGDDSKPVFRHIDDGDAWTLRIERASYINIENLHFDGSELPDRSRHKPSAIMIEGSDHVSLN